MARLEIHLNMFNHTLYKSQHTPVVQLFSSIDYCTKHFHYLRNIGFNAADLTHDDVPQPFKMAALQWLCHKVGNHVFCKAPLNANLFHICPIRDEEVPDVNVSRPLTTWGFTIFLQ